jgi:hypothetical protein
MKNLRSSDRRHAGDIRLSERLGHGSKGTVYFGVTPVGGRIAVKMIRDELTERSGVSARFDYEIDIPALRRGCGSDMCGNITTMFFAPWVTPKVPGCLLVRRSRASPINLSSTAAGQPPSMLCSLRTARESS